MKPETFATFVPGAAGSGSFWLPVVQQLPATWRVQLVDLPGLGSTSRDAAVSSYDDLVDYVARRIQEPTVLIGQSMGGFIGLQLALRYPHLVTHLVLVVSAGGVDMAAHQASDWREDYVKSYPHAEAWACDAVPDLTPQLKTLAIPVLLIWATRDPLSPLAVAQTIATAVPDAVLVTIDTADHWVARQRPEDTARIIRAWLGR